MRIDYRTRVIRIAKGCASISVRPPSHRSPTLLPASGRWPGAPTATSGQPTRGERHMAHTTKAARIGAVLFTAAFAFAACSSSTGGATTAPATAAAPSAAPASMTPESMAPESMAPESMAATMTGPFGPACASLPADGAGSVGGMALDPVATAASNNPALSTLVTAVTAAGLGETLNTTDDITVFAPTNDAFTALDKATLDAALADPKGLLTTVLTYHVVPGRITPEMLAGSHTTLQGGTIDVTGSGEDFTVNGTSHVVCGNVQTKNATVYIIDGVLLPKS
jgi:uncharacterized surface protein with fasciclin (FAS1) repeats